MARTKASKDQLPLFEGNEVRKAVVAFGGKIELDPTQALDAELLDALRWGRLVEVTLEVGTKAWRVAGSVDQRGYVFKFEDAERVPTTTCKVTIDSRMLAPGELSSRRAGEVFGGPRDGDQEDPGPDDHGE